MEWMDYTKGLCSGCRNPVSETMNPDNDGMYEAVPVTCFACAARDAETRAINQARSDQSHGSGSFDGLLISIQKRET